MVVIRNNFRKIQIVYRIPLLIAFGKASLSGAAEYFECYAKERSGFGWKKRKKRKNKCFLLNWTPRLSIFVILFLPWALGYRVFKKVNIIVCGKLVN